MPEAVAPGSVPSLSAPAAEHELVRRRLRDTESLGLTGCWELDPASGRLGWSDGMFVIYGVNRDAVGDLAQLAADCIHSGDRSRLLAVIDRCLDAEDQVTVRYRVRRPDDDELRWMDSRIAPLRVDGQPTLIGGTVRDVTELVVAEASADAAMSFQQATVDASADLVFVYDVPSRATVWSNRSLPGAGDHSFDLHRPGHTTGDTVNSSVPADDLAQFNADVADSLTATTDVTVQIYHRLQDAGGDKRWFLRRTTPLRRDSHGRITALVGVLRDVTDSMSTETQLQHAAVHDSLTGLPNRALLIDRLGQALARSGRDHREIAVLFCDLDGFKRVNDVAGRSAGDAVLIETAIRLQSILRDGDTVARVGGDEFVIVLEPWNRGEHSGAPQDRPDDVKLDRELAPRVAERVAAAVREPIMVNGVEHVVTASIGITYGSLTMAGNSRSVTADEVLQDADAAMYQAKGRGKDRIEIFEHSMRSDALERGRVEHVLRQALRLPVPAGIRAATHIPEQGTSSLSAEYQPIFESRTGQLVGFEALARLKDAAGTRIRPDVFIPVAEEIGLIRALGTMMLELACGQLARWRADDPGLPPLTMAVNVSALHARHTTLSDDVHEALARHHLSPADLVLELTETAMLQAAESTIAALRELREQGVGIAIDDFGTGYASLSYLATLPVSALKIDKSFTAGLPGNPISTKIVGAVAGLAADLDLMCIVEGVETNVQREALPAGVHIQGYLTGRPQSAQLLDLPGLLAQDRWPADLISSSPRE